jgi:hypothetical protein
MNVPDNKIQNYESTSTAESVLAVELLARRMDRTIESIFVAQSTLQFKDLSFLHASVNGTMNWNQVRSARVDCRLPVAGCHIALFPQWQFKMHHQFFFYCTTTSYS